MAAAAVGGGRLVRATRRRVSGAERLLAMLPEGRLLPMGAWRARHRAVLVLLWLHALALAAFGVARGFGLVHGVGEALPIVAAAVLAAQSRLGRRWRSAIASTGLITASAVLVHFSGGYVEAHFHFFVMVVVIGLYQDWVPFLVALGYVVLHHGILGVLAPAAVFNHPDAVAYPWKWAAIHGGFVLAASAATVANWRLNEAVRERIEQSEARLRLLTRQMPAILWSTDGELRFVAAQGGGLAAVGVRSRQLVGSLVEEHFGGGDPDVPTPAVAAHRWALQGKSVAFELVWGGRTFEARVEPLRRPGGVVGTVGVAVDITDGLAAEDERRRLEATSRAKSAFLANMSHEIRTPMNAILGMADLLAETDLSHEQREYVAIFRRAGDALLAVINDILDLSKVEAGQMELERIAFDPAELAEGVAEVLAVRAHAKGLELTCEVAEEVPARIQGDPQRLRQVLLNLLGNAVKFTERGEVGLRLDVVPATETTAGAAAGAAAETGDGALPEGGRGARTGRPALRCTVRDTGIGIAPAKLAGVFDAFTQADASTTRRFGGTGLGLAIVKRLVELMGGTVGAESAPGSGSVFTVAVPLEVAAGGETPGPAAGTLAGARVLVIDDNATNRLILHRQLVAHGARVEEAAGGALGLTALCAARDAGTPYDLVLLDRKMPDLDGFEVVARAQRAAAESTSGALHASLEAMARAVLMLTSDQRVGDAAQVKELGLGGYLVKPVKRADLLEAATAVRGRAAAAEVTPAGAGRPGAVEPSGRGPKRRRLLLVDDSADNRRLVQLYLSRLPYILDTAADGQAGLTAFVEEDGTYDLVLMDMHMPVLDGLAATRAIRDWERDQGRARTPVIALTASAMTEDVQQALDAGCDAHVAKPVKKDTLLRAIERHGRLTAAAEVVGVGRVAAVPEREGVRTPAAPVVWQ